MEKGRKAIGSKPPAPTVAATAPSAELNKPECLTPGTAVAVEDAEGKSLGNVRKLKEAGTLTIRKKDGTVYDMPVSTVTPIWAIPCEEFLKILGATVAAHERRK